jgi:hypothetical protein
MRQLGHIPRTAVIAVCLACGLGPSLIRGPTPDTRATGVSNDSLALQAAAVIEDKPYRLLRVEVTAQNKLDRAVMLSVPGGCPVIFQVLDDAPPSGRQVWNSRDARSSRGCALSLVQVRIDSRQSKVFVREVERSEVLGDSLPPARYFLRAQLDITPSPIVIDAGLAMLSK